MDTSLFHYCQKIVIFSEDLQSVLLCKRKDEKDFDGIFSFIGGKMETTDKDILEGLKREKEEEIGANAKIKIYTKFTTQEEYSVNIVGEEKLFKFNFGTIEKKREILVTRF